jgi:hypothetical protein
MPVGFQGINPYDPLMTEIEHMMEKVDQFFYVTGAIHMKMFITSTRSAKMISTAPEDVTL